MDYEWYHQDIGKLTGQRVRQIITVGLPSVILPEDVAEFGFIPFVNIPQPEITSHQKIEDGGLQVDDGVCRNLWSIVNLSGDELAAVIAAEAKVIATDAEFNSIESQRYRLKIQLGERYTLERNKGITVNGIEMSTSNSARLEVAALIELLTRQGGEGSQKAVTRKRQRIDLNLEQATAILIVIDQHVSDCNTCEHNLDEAIDNSNDMANIDITAGWPV